MTTRRRPIIDPNDIPPNNTQEESPMTDTDAPEWSTVEPGESAQMFAERHGVHPDRIHELNRDALANEARARGFDAHTFLRRVPNDDGTYSERPDFHVFAGQLLRVRPPAEE